MQENSATLLVGCIGIIALGIYIAGFSTGITEAMQTMMATFHR
ncbi:MULTISPECIES: hypothetical protein [Bacillus cereus group]|nr:MULTISPECIES: hypothetical protein [Bacillus cereus group]